MCLTSRTESVPVRRRTPPCRRYRSSVPGAHLTHFPLKIRKRQLSSLFRFSRLWVAGCPGCSACRSVSEASFRVFAPARSLGALSPKRHPNPPIFDPRFFAELLATTGSKRIRTVETYFSTPSTFVGQLCWNPSRPAPVAVVGIVVYAEGKVQSNVPHDHPAPWLLFFGAS